MQHTFKLTTTTWGDDTDWDYYTKNGRYMFGFCDELNRWFYIPENVYEIELVVSDRPFSECYKVATVIERLYSCAYELYDSKGKAEWMEGGWRMPGVLKKLGFNLDKTLYVGVQYEEAVVRYRD